MPLVERISAEGLRELDQVACKAFKLLSALSLIFRERDFERGG